jgi:hypothetical protein
MQITTRVRFTDKGEAARFLAAVHSRVAEIPRPLAEALRAEFPYGTYGDVALAVILDAAIQTLTDRLPTSEVEAETERWAWKVSDPAIGPSLWWDYADAMGVVNQRGRFKGIRVSQVVVVPGDVVSRLGAPDERVTA